MFLYEKTSKKEHGEELERLKEIKKQAERRKPSFFLKEYHEDIEIQEKKIADLKESTIIYRYSYQILICAIEGRMEN